MIRMRTISRRGLRRCLAHQDPHSEQHRQDMQFRGAGVPPDPWLAKLNSYISTFDSFQGSPSKEDVIQRMLVRAKTGRRPKRAVMEIGYCLVFNPPDALQARLRALSIVAPDEFLSMHENWDRLFSGAIAAEFPKALGQVAFHGDTGRWHKEASVCKLGLDGNFLPWAIGLRYDEADRTTIYETRLFSRKAVSELRVNSRLAHDLCHVYDRELGKVEEVLRLRGLRTQYEQACLNSRLALIAQAIRREMGLVLGRPLRGKRKIADANARVQKWTEEFKALSPTATPPQLSDFSLVGLISRDIQASPLTAECKRLWIDALKECLRKQLRLGLRPLVSNLSTENVEKLIDEVLALPLSSHASISHNIRTKVIPALESHPKASFSLGQTVFQVLIRLYVQARLYDSAVARVNNLRKAAQVSQLDVPKTEARRR